MADDLKLKYEVNLTKTGDGAAAAAKELQEVGKAGEKAGQSIASMGREFKATIAAVAASAVIRESIQSFTEQDAASRRLSGTLTAMGRNAGDTARQLQALAQSVVLPPGATRNSVLDGITELVRNGASSNELPRLTQQVLDLAAAGMTVERAADVMGNAISGDFGKLSKILNVDFPAGAGRAQNLAEALRLVQERFGGLASAASGGAAGQLSQFSEAATSLKASLGEMLMTGATPYLRNLAESMQWWNGIINGTPGQPYERAPGAPGGPLRPPMAAAVNPSANYDPATAARQLAEQQRALQLEAAENAIGLGEVRLGSRSAGGRISPIGLATGQRDVLTGMLDEQLSKGLIKETEYREALKSIDHEYYMSRAQLAAQAVEVEQELAGRLADKYEQRAVQVQREYANARDIIAARYQFEIEQAEAAGQATEGIVARQEEAFGRLAAASKQAQYEASFLGATLVDVGQKGAQAFSVGLAGAMVQFASGAKSAKEAFSQFAASFLQQIANMILQALILRAVQGIFGAFSGGGGVRGGVQGGFGALNTGVQMAAEGGIIPRKMALGGIQTVNTATYLPRFNAIAGEAGAEVLAVLSRPRFMEIGGLASYVGSVQGQRVAMTNADDLARSAGGRGGAGGTIVVEVRGTRDFEARVIDSSIEGAVVRVVNDLHQDGPMSNAVKGLTS